MFARSKAAETLHAILGILNRRWSTLDDATHREIEARIRQYGPEVVSPATSDEIRPILSLLESLRAIQGHLPPGVGAALDAAWGAPDEFTLRLTPEERRMLQDDMIALVDFRVYRSAAGSRRSILNERICYPDRGCAANLPIRQRLLSFGAGRHAATRASHRTSGARTRR